MTGKTLVIRVGAMGDDPQAFIDVWQRAERGETIAPSYGLTFESITGLLSTLTPKRLSLIEHLKREGAMTIYALAKALGRNYKNVHADVRALAALDIIQHTPDGRIEVPWDAIEAHFKLAA